MNEQLYRSALSHLRVDEAFEQKACSMLLAKERQQHDNTEKRRMNMEKSKRNTMLKLGGGLAACAVFAVCVVSAVQLLKPSDAIAPDTGSTPAIHAKVMVNIEGEITAVSDDGKSFQVGDLWVTVDGNTRFGSPEPTASTDETLLSKEFKVGNIVAGYTADDVTTGKVTADTIYNNMVPQK